MAQGAEMVLERQEIILVLLVDFIAVAEQLLKRHRSEGHRFQQVEIAARRRHSPVQALHERCRCRI